MKSRYGSILLLLIALTCTIMQPSNAQTQLWIRKITPMVVPLTNGYPVQRDAVGNIYYAYASLDAVTFSSNFELAKYTPAGVKLWRRIYNSGGDEFVSSMGIDSLGNVYVGGTSHSATGNDFLIVKYNTNGVRQWVRRYDGAAHKDEFLSRLAIAPDDTICVVGSEEITAITSYCVTAKYDPAGTLLWMKRERPSVKLNAGFGVQVAADGSVYLAGSVQIAVGNTNGLLIKYNSAGTRQWIRTWDGVAHQDDAFGGVKIDGLGDVYVGGGTLVAPGNTDTLVVKYTPAGLRLWQKTYDGPANRNDIIFDGAIDATGNIYVVGNSQGASFADALILKYSPTGAPLFVKRINTATPATGNASFNAIALDNAGNLYMTGSVGGIVSDMYVAKYTARGARLWTKRYNDSRFNNVDRGLSIAVDPVAGFAYVGGTSFYISASNSPGAVLFKYQ